MGMTCRQRNNIDIDEALNIAGENQPTQLDKELEKKQEIIDEIRKA